MVVSWFGQKVNKSLDRSQWLLASLNCSERAEIEDDSAFRNRYLRGAKSTALAVELPLLLRCLHHLPQSSISRYKKNYLLISNPNILPQPPFHVEIASGNVQ